MRIGGSRVVRGMKCVRVRGGVWGLMVEGRKGWKLGVYKGLKGVYEKREGMYEKRVGYVVERGFGGVI